MAKSTKNADTARVPSAGGMATKETKLVACRSPQRSGESVTMEKWRYDVLRRAILNVVPSDDIGIMYKQLVPAVRANLSKKDRERVGSIHFYTTLVKLDLEVRGDLMRIEGMRPQYLRQKARRKK